MAAQIDPMKTPATIVYTNNHDEQLSAGASYWDCFKGFELRRTEIACVVFAGQILCGICFAYNSSYFFQNVVMGTSATYSLALGGTAFALVGCFVNWFSESPAIMLRVFNTLSACPILLFADYILALMPYFDSAFVTNSRSPIPLRVNIGN